MIEAMNKTLIRNALKRFRSMKTRYDKENRIKLVLEYLYAEHGVKPILEYTTDEIEDLFLWIERKPIQRKAKYRYRLNLHTIISYALKLDFKANKDKIGYWNFLLSDEFFQFSESGSTPREYPQIKPDQIHVFLDQLRTTHVRNYIYFAILAYSGCRVGGLVHLEIKNIFFDEGYFISQEKPTDISSGLNRYFLPAKFMTELKHYIQKNAIHGNLCKVSEKQIRQIMKQIRPQWWPHLLRHSLRVNWHLNGMPDLEAHFLLNHAPANVDQFYLKQLNNTKHLRECYLKYFPY